MIEVADSSATYYYHFDGLGSVVALSDSAGDTVQTYEYSIYGRVAASDANHPNPYLFTGRRFDRETGLYYYRARYYNPYIGRFMQTDPVGYGDGINWYRYCGNNPLAFIDTSGCWAYKSFEWINWSPYYKLIVTLHNADGSVADYRFFKDVADYQASDWAIGDFCDVRIGDFDDIIVNDPLLPWWTKLAEIGILITIPAGSCGWFGGGHDIIWLPGEGWKSYAYGQFGTPTKGEGHIGIGIVVNIQTHEDYRGPYANVSMLVPTQFGSVGVDFSTWPEQPTAISIIYGIGFGISMNFQWYEMTGDALNRLLNWIQEQEWILDDEIHIQME